jgi:periplasmic divalent cation tolerance protein
MAFIVIYTTYPNKKVASKIVKHLLQKKLVACSNMFPISSSYWWKGKICNDKEICCILKSKEKNFTLIVKEIKKMHPYDVPCIERIKASANNEFEEWINGVTK